MIRSEILSLVLRERRKRVIDRIYRIYRIRGIRRKLFSAAPHLLYDSDFAGQAHIRPERYPGKLSCRWQ